MKYKINDDDDPYVMIEGEFLKYLSSETEIECVFINCGDVPTEIQVAVIDKIKIHGKLLFGVILKESIDYWNKKIDDENLGEIMGMGKIVRAIDLSDYLDIGRIYVHNDFRINGCTTIGFSGSWAMDDEHGYGITFKYIQNKDEFNFIEVGYQDLAMNDDFESYNFNSRSEILEAISSIREENAKIIKMVESGTWKMSYSGQSHVDEAEKYIKELIDYCDKWYPE